MDQKNFSIVVAVNNDSLIGIKEYGSYSIPWPIIKDDMNFFRKTTTTCLDSQINACIIGYNTWQTMPNFYKKNKKRFNIIVTRHCETIDSNTKFVASFEEALSVAILIENLNEIFVIGGSFIYDIALMHPSLKKIYVTHVKNSYPSTNIIENEIYFPLTHYQLQAMVENNILVLASNSGDKYDISKNIHFCFREYHVVENKLHSHYSSIVKNPRIINRAVPIEIPIYFPSSGEYQYLNLVKNIIDTGIDKTTRNAVTRSILGYQMRFNLQDGYPLSTVKKSYPKSIFEELMWMIRGQTNVKILQDKNVNIWNKNSSKHFINECGLSYDEGDIGPGYGFQMKHYGAQYIDCQTNYHGQGVDQLHECINLINTNPYSRRIIINLWNPNDVRKQTLPPCHCLYQFTVDIYEKIGSNGHKGKLNCILFQRSWDVMLGWNTTTAALLTYLLANHCCLDPGMLIHSIADAHLYKEHIDSGLVDSLLRRTPRTYPILRILTRRNNIEDYQYDDLQIENYYPCPSICADMVA